MTKKLTKRIISIMVTLAMTAALLPVLPAMAATTKQDPATTAAALAKELDQSFSTESNKGTNVQVDGNTVKLLNNIDNAPDIYWNGSGVTLDVDTHADFRRTYQLQL